MFSWWERLIWFGFDVVEKAVDVAGKARDKLRAPPREDKQGEIRERYLRRIADGEDDA